MRRTQPSARVYVSLLSCRLLMLKLRDAPAHVTEYTFKTFNLLLERSGFLFHGRCGACIRGSGNGRCVRHCPCAAKTHASTWATTPAESHAEPSARHRVCVSGRRISYTITCGPAGHRTESHRACSISARHDSAPSKKKTVILLSLPFHTSDTSLDCMVVRQHAGLSHHISDTHNLHRDPCPRDGSSFRVRVRRPVAARFHRRVALSSPPFSFYCCLY